jgi:hypothetical protein
MMNEERRPLPLEFIVHPSAFIISSSSFIVHTSSGREGIGVLRKCPPVRVGGWVGGGGMGEQNEKGQMAR